MLRSRRGSKKQMQETLRAIPLFSDLSNKELSAVAELVRENDYEADDKIVEEGHAGVGLHAIEDGEARIEVGGRTRRRIGPGDFFGEIAVLDGGPRSATVVAATPVRTISISAWDLRSTLEEHPKMALKMVTELCRRLRDAEKSPLSSI